MYLASVLDIGTRRLLGYSMGEHVRAELVLGALAESWFATLKREFLHGKQWIDQRQARRDVLQWTAFYNHRRRHSALGMFSPVEYENRSSTLAAAA